MTDMPDTPDPRQKWLSVILCIIGILLTLLAAVGCSPRIVENIVTRHDTTFVERVRVDSLIARDSVFVKEKGDTIYVYKERVRERWRLVRDTIAVVKVDSVAVESIKEVEVEKELSRCQEFKIGAFWWLAAVAVALLLWTFRKIW